MAKQTQGTDYARRFPGFKEAASSDGGWNWQWERPGTELIGEFLSIEQFKNGYKAKVREADGTIRLFSAPAVLADQLQGVNRGAEIVIIFTHQDAPKTKGQSGVKHFKLLVKDE